MHLLNSQHCADPGAVAPGTEVLLKQKLCMCNLLSQLQKQI